MPQRDSEQAENTGLVHEGPPSPKLTLSTSFPSFLFATGSITLAAPAAVCSAACTSLTCCIRFSNPCATVLPAVSGWVPGSYFPARKGRH